MKGTFNFVNLLIPCTGQLDRQTDRSGGLPNRCPLSLCFFFTIFMDTLVALMRGLFPIAGLEYEMERLMHTLTGNRHC